MVVVYREFTLREALEALEADAIPWTSGILTSYKADGETIGAACAIGIMAVNLGVDANDLQTHLGKFMLSGGSLATKIIKANDSFSLADAIAVTKVVSQEQLDTKMKVVSKVYLSEILK